MGLENFEALKSKIKAFFPRLRDGRPGALPAVIALIILGLILVFFNIIDKSDDPTIKTNNRASEDRKMLDRVAEEPFHYQLDKIIEATKKKPFKAKITTEVGIKGYWTQSGIDYRFEDPSRSNIIILNSSQEKLWVIDLAAKIAHETPFNTSNLNHHNELIPTLLIEGLSTSTATGTKNLEDILPGGKNAKLTFTPHELPDRWDGSRRDGAACFIDWDYIQLDNISPTEFEPPQGLTIIKPAQGATTTTTIIK